MTARLRAALCRLSRLGRADDGVTPIEFAIYAPALFILVLGVLEFGLDMMVDASVQYAAQQASRAGITTSAPTTGTREQAATQTVQTILKPWTNMGATLTTTIYDYGTFGNTSPTAGSAGGLGDVVAYSIRLSFPKGFTGMLAVFGLTPLVFTRNYLVQNEK